MLHAINFTLRSEVIVLVHLAKHAVQSLLELNRCQPEEAMSAHQLSLLADLGLEVVSRLVVARDAYEHLLFELKLGNERSCLLILDVLKDVGWDLSISREDATKVLWTVERCLHR